MENGAYPSAIPRLRRVERAWSAVIGPNPMIARKPSIMMTRLGEQPQLRGRSYAVAALLVAVFCFWSTAAQATVEFVFPATKGWVNRSNHLIIKLNNPDITGVKVAVNGLASDMLPVG